jgi:hypothetical protein
MRSAAIAAGIAAVVGVGALAGCSASVSTNSSSAAAPVPNKHFVNSPDDAKAPSLAQHYVDFSFDYPGNWTPDPANGTPTASNFVKFERDNDQNVTIENFAVGSFSGSGDPTADAAQLPQLLATFEAQVNTMPGYKRLSIGEPTTVDGIQGQQLTFTANPVVNGTPANLFGRIIILPGPAGQANGVTLILLGTDASGEIHSVADLGVKGQLPIILNSFKFGTPSGAAAPAGSQPPAQAPASNAGSSSDSDSQ